MKNEPDNDLTPTQSIDEAGQSFDARLLRHFHCDRSEQNTILRMASEVPTPRPRRPTLEGDEFISRSLKYCNQGASLVEDVPAGDYEQTETAA